MDYQGIIECDFYDEREGYGLWCLRQLLASTPIASQMVPFKKCALLIVRLSKANDQPTSFLLVLGFLQVGLIHEKVERYLLCFVGKISLKNCITHKKSVFHNWLIIPSLNTTYSAIPMYDLGLVRVVLGLLFLIYFPDTHTGFSDPRRDGLN